MTMIRVNIHDAKTNLSRYLKRVERGETILLCRHNVPIAEIRPVIGQRDSPRPIGLQKGSLHVPDAFFDPLPDDLLDEFEGRSG